MPIKAKARARGLMGVACIVALRAAGPQRSAIPGGCTQNTLKSFEGSIEVVENRFKNSWWWCVRLHWQPPPPRLAKAAIPRPFLAGAAAAFPCRVHSQKALGSFEEPVMMVENRFAS